MNSFEFSISDLGIFLGKSPVTIRGWERKGLVDIPRKGVNRVLDTDEVRTIARAALRNERISERRYMLIAEALTSLRLIEDYKENE
jgi:hypothetical protein